METEIMKCIQFGWNMLKSLNVRFYLWIFFLCAGFYGENEDKV